MSWPTLGVADALQDEPATAADLASHTGANADALNRVLRLLAAHDVFAWELRKNMTAYDARTVPQLGRRGPNSRIFAFALQTPAVIDASALHMVLAVLTG
jgi:hypothetical protein